MVTKKLLLYSSKTMQFVLSIFCNLGIVKRKEVTYHMATSNRGLGSPNMSEEEKRRIQSEGGKASHGGGRKRSRGNS
jgi:hypothetical protein